MASVSADGQSWSSFGSRAIGSGWIALRPTCGRRGECRRLALRLLRRWALIYDGVRECVEAGERDEQVFGQAEARQRGTRVANGHVRHRLTTPLALAQRCPQAPKLTRAPSLARPAAERR